MFRTTLPFSSAIYTVAVYPICTKKIRNSRHSELRYWCVCLKFRQFRAPLRD